MEVNLSPELEAKLNRKAAQEGRDSQSLVQEAVERLVSYDEWFVREVEKGLAAADSGDFLESLRFDMKSAGVYAYTPRGDVIHLPEKASPIAGRLCCA